MSDSSSLTYRDLAIPYFLEVFTIVEEVMKANKTPYYLIGVTAADIQLLKEIISRKELKSSPKNLIYNAVAKGQNSLLICIVRGSFSEGEED